MDFAQFLLVLQARKRIITYTLIIVVATTITVNLLLPKSYKASATMVLNNKGTDPVTGIALPGQLTPDYMATQVDIIKSPRVAAQVADDLKLAEKPEIQQAFKRASKGEGKIGDWLVAGLQKKIDVTPSHESSVLEVSVKDSSAQSAAMIANAYVLAYQQTSIRLKIEPLKMASDYFARQIKASHERFELAQQKLAKYQQEKGIVSIDHHFDVESLRLNELSAQLVTAQGQSMEASARRQHGQGNGETPEVIANPLIHQLTSSLAQAEARFAEVAQKFGNNHPQYQAAKIEVERARTALNANVNTISRSVANNAGSLAGRAAEIRVALEQQRQKVLDLNRARSELLVLEKEVESAQRAYESTGQRLTQTSLEAQSNQSEVALLSLATPPLAASEPKVLLNILISVFLGSMLGVGLALLMESLDRRVRSALDLQRGLSVPVLGMLAWDKPPRSAWSRFCVRAQAVGDARLQRIFPRRRDILFCAYSHL